MRSLPGPGRAPFSPQNRGQVPAQSLISRLWCSLAFLAIGATALPQPVHAATIVASTVNTDTPLYRATHNPLIGIGRAGDRLVAVGDHGVILLSDDEGKSWRLAKSPASGVLTSVMFLNPQVGFVAGQDELILRTTDGGETWTQVYAKDKADRMLFSMTRTDAGTMIAAGAYAVALQSTNGTDWSEIKMPSFDDDYHFNCVMSVGDDLVITGESGHAFLRRGDTWIAMPVPYDGSQFGCLTTKDQTIYSFGLRGSLFRAHPPQTLPPPPPATKAESGDPQVTPIGEIKDAWTRIETGNGRPIFGGSVLDDGRLALVGANGYVALVDPAHNDKISTIPMGSDETISAVLPTHDGALVIVGDDGVQRVSLPQDTGAAQ